MANIFKVGEFQAAKTKSSSIQKTEPRKPILDAVRSPDVQMSILLKRYEKETTEFNKIKIKDQIRALMMVILAYFDSCFNNKEINFYLIFLLYFQSRKLTDSTFNQIVSESVKLVSTLSKKEIYNQKKKLSNHECYFSVLERLFEKCFNAKNEYGLRKLYLLVNLCENGFSSQIIMNSIDNACLEKTQF